MKLMAVNRIPYAYHAMSAALFYFLERSVGVMIDPDWRQVFPVLAMSDGFVQWSICGKFSRYFSILNLCQ